MQNTACSININGRADNAPPGHDRQQQDGSLRLGGCWALRDTQNSSIRVQTLTVGDIWAEKAAQTSGFGVETPKVARGGEAEQINQHRPSQEMEKGGGCLWEWHPNIRTGGSKPSQITTGGKSEQGKQHRPGEEMQKGRRCLPVTLEERQSWQLYPWQLQHLPPAHTDILWGWILWSILLLLHLFITSV